MGVLQADLGSELLEEVKREASALGLTASSYVRMLVKQRRVAAALSEKGGSKKATKRRAKRSVITARRKP